MARVLGIGGVFFKARDPEALSAWYQRWLHFPIEPDAQNALFKPADVPAGGLTVWSPFPAATTYFDPSERPFMINLIVDDLDAALAQVEEGGATRVGAVEDYSYGRFGWFLDPEGNKVELWQPVAGGF